MLPFLLNEIHSATAHFIEQEDNGKRPFPPPTHSRSHTHIRELLFFFYCVVVGDDGRQQERNNNNNSNCIQFSRQQHNQPHSRRHFMNCFFFHRLFSLFALAISLSAFLLLSLSHSLPRWLVQQVNAVSSVLFLYPVLCVQAQSCSQIVGGICTYFI